METVGSVGDRVVGIGKPGKAGGHFLEEVELPGLKAPEKQVVVGVRRVGIGLEGPADEDRNAGEDREHDRAGRRDGRKPRPADALGFSVFARRTCLR